MISESKTNENVLGRVPPREERRKRPKLLITDILSDYAKNSTIHGLRYVAENGLTTTEKLFWIVTFTGCVIICSVLINNIYFKWRNGGPVFTTVSDRIVSVGEIPFPSVTICNQIKSKATVYNFSQERNRLLKNVNEPSEQDINKLADTSIICGVDFVIGERLFVNESIVKNIDQVSPNLDDYILMCKWHNTYDFRCTDLFQKVYTAEGLCYNMNGLASVEMFRDTVQANYNYSDGNELTKGWSLRDGYTGTEAQPFPRQGIENSADPDLEVFLSNRAEDNDDFCNRFNSGFKIYIQHPTDHPQSSLYYHAALDQQVTSMAISADVLSSPDYIRGYPAETRQCYFQEDRTLRYFKIYTASNCRAECISNYTYKECGCVGFHMPHDNSSEICAEKKIYCMKHAQKVLAETELQIRINKSGDGCRCLAACNSIEYNAEILKTEFNFKRVVEKALSSRNETYKENFIANTYSKIELYFKKPQFVSMRRSCVEFGITDFVANIGGLLGVFIGFSFLSFVEVFYFITLRLGCNYMNDLKQEKSQPTIFQIANDTTDNCN